MAGTRRLVAGRRGPGGLSADEVAADQRLRMLTAFVELAARDGYARTSVAGVLDRAGVSRATFYEQFTDKQDCFLAAFDTAAELLFAPLSEPPAGPITPAALRRVVREYLNAVADHPDEARVLLVGIHELGAAGLRRRAAGQQRIAASLARLTAARGERRRFACEAFVAAVGSLVTARLAEDDVPGVRALATPLGALAVQMLLSG